MDTNASAVPPAPVTQMQAPPAPQPNAAPPGMSHDTKTIIVVLTLLFAYPVGLLLMFMWMKWRWWIKLLIALPFPLTIILIPLFVVGLLLAINPAAQLQKARAVQLQSCVKQCEAVYPGDTSCVQKCNENVGK